jgi:hypothetical protein
MTLADFFLAVNAAGIRLANCGGQLQLRGPATAITPAIRAGAAEHKAAVLALLPPLACPGGKGDDRSQPAGESATGPEGEGQVTNADGFRHTYDWRDWRIEWLLEIGTLFLRMRACPDPDVLARLRPLAEATPTSLADWLVLGRQIVNTEHELRQLGKLPPVPRPGGAAP